MAAREARHVIERVFDRRGLTPQKLGSAFQQAGHRVISAKHIKGGRIDLLAGEDRFVDEVTYRRWMSSPLLSGDVLVTSEAPLGEVAYVHEDQSWCIGQRLFALRPASSKMNGRFLYFALQSPAVAEDIQRRATGTTAQGIRQPELLNVQVPAPELAEQEAIAATLGALDDKIDVSRRMSATLEAMARALFKSWFVDFDPVRAKKEGRKPEGMDAATAALFPDDFEASELGPIPRGWARKRLGDLVELKRGYDLPRAQRAAGHVPIVSSSGISGTHDRAMAQAPGIVTGRYGTIGKVFYVREPFWPLNTTLYVHDFKSTNAQWAFHLLSLIDFEKFSDKAAVPGINRNHLHEEQVIVARREIQDAFGRVASAFADKSAHVTSDMKTLSELRDTLLPKLLSGELRVPEAERIVAEAV